MAPKKKIIKTPLSSQESDGCDVNIKSLAKYRNIMKPTACVQIFIVSVCTRKIDQKHSVND